MTAPGTHKQSGAIALIAVMIVVFLALIGTFIARSSQTQHLTILLSWYNAQTWFAARSGLQWAMEQATRSQASHDAICGSPAITTSFNQTLAGQNYTITVSCNDQGGFTEAGSVYEVDAVTVTASRGVAGNFDYASRTVQGVVTRGTPLP